METTKNKAEAKLRVYTDCKEDKIINHNATDLCKKYIHEIRNIKPLDKEMINNIRNMSNEEKINIIITFNEMIRHLKDILE